MLTLHLLKVNVNAYWCLNFYIRPRCWTVRECFMLTFEDALFMFYCTSCNVNVFLIDHRRLLFSSDRVTQAGF